MDDAVGVDGLKDDSNAWEILSERETQIAVLVARGKGTKQIAGHLYISEHTVRSYMRRMFSKLRVSTRPAMVAQLLKAGIVFPELPQAGCRSRSENRRPKGKYRP